MINMQYSLSLAIRFSLILMFLGLSCSLAVAASATSDIQELQGRWVRTDAPYVIELSPAQDGSLQAAYFNPRPINVGKTEIMEQGGSVQVLVELQDVNYPGSTYILVYDRAQKMLRGVYFHPASKQKYDVIFVQQQANR